MKAAPLLIQWHNDSAPIYSAHFEPHGKDRLATAGGDNNVRLWKVDQDGEERKITYLSTLVKHTQAVNVVRWCPRGELLASAGDDGNVLLWVPSESVTQGHTFGEEALEDKESWHVKRMCRSTSGSEIYDLAWSPDGHFFVTGSMDNIARIFDAQTGNIVRQIAEHSHYVQGVAWDPLNEFLATQSSDRSVHIYKLRANDGQFSLDQHSRMSRMDLPARRRTSSSPAPPDFNVSHRAASPLPSTPGTPTSLALPMNPPPPTSHSRRSSFGNASPAIHRSASPAPSIPLPAVMPSPSPNLQHGLGVKNAMIYANETLTSFFRRLTFAPDGSLLFTPAGQYKTSSGPGVESGKPSDQVTNTVYIYGRGGLNKPPIAHLPGHKKPSIAVRCSPIYYNLRLPAATVSITIDTSAGSNDMSLLPEPVLPSKLPPSQSSMEPPPPLAPSPSPSVRASSPRPSEPDSATSISGPSPAFSLPYRIVYAVATQDAIFVYDTQQQTPLCIVNNLHFAPFTDIAWSNDGATLLMTSSDGFCSALSFETGELGTTYSSSLHVRSHHPPALNTSTSAQPTPTATPTTATMPALARYPSSGFAPSPSPMPATTFRPASPTRSNSASSIATQSSFAQTSVQNVIYSNPTPSFGSVPGVAAANSNPVTSSTSFTSPTPPMTPQSHAHTSHTSSTLTFAAPPPIAAPAASVLGKREGEEQKEEESKEPKKRRIAPTPITDSKEQTNQ